MFLEVHCIQKQHGLQHGDTFRTLYFSSSIRIPQVEGTQHRLSAAEDQVICFIYGTL